MTHRPFLRIWSAVIAFAVCLIVLGGLACPVDASNQTWVIKNSADGTFIRVVAPGKSQFHGKLTFVYSKKDCKKASSEFYGVSRTADLKPYVGQRFPIELNGTLFQPRLRKVIGLENPTAKSVQVGLFVLGLHDYKLVAAWERVLTRTRNGQITIQFIGNDKTDAGDVFANEVNNWPVVGLSKAMLDAYSMCRFG